MRTKKQARLSLEAFDDRIVPATFSASHSGSTLVITQTSPAVGAIFIVDNPAAGTVTVDDILDANPPMVISTAGFANLKVNLTSTDVTPVVYDPLSARGGNLTLNVKNTGARVLDMMGGFTIGGNLMVVGGNGGLTVNEVASPLKVAGNATFIGGFGMDVLNLTGAAGTAIGGSLTTTKFNTVTTGPGDAIGGSFNFNDAGEMNANHVMLNNTAIGGNLNYVGGSRSDVILMIGAVTKVDGNVSVNFGSQLPADVSGILQLPSPTNIIAGNVKVTAGSLGTDEVLLHGVVGGNITLNLGGTLNIATVDGLFEGASMSYTGSAGVDNLTYAPMAGSNHAKLKAIMGAGNDVITFGPGSVTPSSAYLDFGAGTDKLFGSVLFPATILNLP
jgi:hypothetical protein